MIESFMQEVRKLPNKSSYWFSERAGMYQNMVKMVKDAFEIDELVKVDCRELERSDMKKIGAKLRVSPDNTLDVFFSILASPLSRSCLLSGVYSSQKTPIR